MNARRAPDDPVEWLNRAESSLTQASHPLDGVYLEDLCAAAHQAAEKAIKSVLLKKAVDYPYVRPRKTPRTCTRLQHRSRDANANVARNGCGALFREDPSLRASIEERVALSS